MLIIYHNLSLSEQAKAILMTPSPNNDSKQQNKAAVASSARTSNCPSFPQLRLPMPTFYNTTGTTRPYYLFPLFLLINIITMADRAIIPGASQEFLGFLGTAHDSPTLVKNNPDAGLVRVYSLCINYYMRLSFIIISYQRSMLTAHPFIMTGNTPSSIHDRIYNLHHHLFTLRSQNAMEAASLHRIVHMVVRRVRFR